MTKEIPGKMYLADQRGMVETTQYQRYSTFNFGPYAAEYKEPFGKLQAFNEETLAGGATLELPPPTYAAHLLILPITGEVQVLAGPATAAVVPVEEVQLLTLPAGCPVQVSNPYDADLVSFLHLWLRADEPVETVGVRVFSFDFQELNNQLVDITSLAKAIAPAGQPLPFSLSLGRFDGRQEAVYRLQPGAGCFAFILAGAFELEGRLMHEKDGLALWDTAEIELEALSNNALVLICELAVKG